MPSEEELDMHEAALRPMGPTWRLPSSRDRHAALREVPLPPGVQGDPYWYQEVDMDDDYAPLRALAEEETSPWPSALLGVGLRDIGLVMGQATPDAVIDAYLAKNPIVAEAQEAARERRLEREILKKEAEARKLQEAKKEAEAEAEERQRMNAEDSWPHAAEQPKAKSKPRRQDGPVYQQYPPDYLVQRNQGQVVLRTGKSGPGQQLLLKYGHGEEYPSLKAALRHAHDWVKRQKEQSSTCCSR